MSDLYTVHMIRKQIVSEFDMRGKKTGERLIDLPQTFHDLPAQTAETYRTTFPDAQVRIERQTEMSGKGGSVGWIEPSVKTTKRYAGEKRPVVPEPAPAPKNTGTYGALVNAMGDE